MNQGKDSFVEDAEVPIRFADMEAYRLGYRDTGGSGQPVVFLHALAGSSASWLPQLIAFRDAGYRAIAPDRRGWGHSSPTNDSAETGTAADDLDAFADMLGLDRFHLVAVAGGGFVALDYAAWRPQRLNRLVIAASTGNIDEPLIGDFRKRIEIPGVSWPSLYLEVGASYRGADPDGLERWEAIYSHARRQGIPPQPPRSPNTFEKLSRIRVPTLAIAGGGDLLAPPALMEIWTRHLPECAFETIGPAGHSINWEYPVAFNRLVLDFIR